ncbi:hypothetical protein F0L68_30380 [Solihabitans fulvus]|uniref:Uncharacterized protein n=1 Tax=Solihabitans fulvus TaxID=1892852 RepID=A0A5B2WUE5_9PSEU|nr:hypothetical protein [Solihabitans fulvus]KAA2254490.1 hypothetical protein F0L68_30380 [Solihabitans fulvus]
MAPYPPAGTVLGRVPRTTTADSAFDPLPYRPTQWPSQPGGLLRTASTSRSYQEECAPGLPCAPLPDVITPSWSQAVLLPLFALALVGIGALVGVATALVLLGLGLAARLLYSLRA